MNEKMIFKKVAGYKCKKKNQGTAQYQIEPLPGFNEV